MRLLVRSASILALCLCIAVPCFAAEQAREESENKELRYFINTYAWLPSISGSTEALGRTTDVNANFFTELLPHLRFGAMVHGELLYRNKFGFAADFIYSSLHDEVGLDTNISFDMLIVDLLPYYRFGTHSFGKANEHSISLDLMAGARIWGMWLDIDAVTSHGKWDIRKHRIWADPIIEARTVLTFGENWLVSLRGGVGGFGVGSDFTWDAAGMVGYRVTDVFTIDLGYKAIGVDYSTQSSPSVRLNLVLHGPFIGMGFLF